MKCRTKGIRDLRRPIGRALVVAALTIGAPVFAAAGSAYMPQQHVQGGVVYVSGGIGQDEAAAMKQAAKRYPLELEFVARYAGGRGAYLAGNKVTIKNAHGRTLLSTTSDGPFLLVRLLPGRYTLRADNEGVAKVRAIRLRPNSHRRIVFEW